MAVASVTELGTRMSLDVRRCFLAVARRREPDLKELHLAQPAALLKQLTKTVARSVRGLRTWRDTERLLVSLLRGRTEQVRDRLPPRVERRKDAWPIGWGLAMQMDKISKETQTLAHPHPVEPTFSRI